MDETTYQQWWTLHLRAASGETLSAEEQRIYEDGRQRLYAEERLEGSMRALQQSRQEMLELKAEYERMRAQYEMMEAEIVALEARLSEKDKQAIGMGV